MRAKEKTDLGWIRFLSVLAFPWFCWLPIVFGFTSFALYHRLSWEWQSISLFWLVIFGFCTVLWVRGKKLEEKARNPLTGILEGYLKPQPSGLRFSVLLHSIKALVNPSRVYSRASRSTRPNNS